MEVSPKAVDPSGAGAGSATSDSGTATGCFPRVVTILLFCKRFDGPMSLSSLSLLSEDRP